MSFLDKIIDTLQGQKSAAGRAFDAALERGDTEFCKIMIDQQPTLAQRVERSVHGEDTFLMAAIRHGNAEVADKLLQHGAKMNVALKYAGDHESAISTVMHPNYRHEAVKDVLLEHYVERQNRDRNNIGILDQVKAKAASLMNSIGRKLDALVQQPGVAIAGVTTVPAALGAAIGASAAGLAVGTMAPALAAASAVGVGTSIVSKIRSDRKIDPVFDRHLDSAAEMDKLAQSYVLRKDRIAQSELPNEQKMVDVSAVLAEDYINAKNYESKPVNQQSGRYSGHLIHETARHVVQDLGRGSAAIHSKNQFDPRVIQAALAHVKSAKIQYLNGHAVIESGVGQSQSRSHGR